MSVRKTGNWSCAEAIALLEQADRMHRQFFHLQPARARGPVWQPPVDVFETHAEIVVLVALPGAAPEGVRVRQEGRLLTVLGERPMPVSSRAAAIRRLEIPFGRFERQIELPSPQITVESTEMACGCLKIVLRKPV